MTISVTPQVSTDEQQQHRQNLAIQALARALGTLREPLTANRTYYVATTGSNSNDGLSAGAPFLTIQKAVDVVAANLDLNGFTVTIQLADGTYTASVALRNVVGFRAAGDLTIQGNNSTPANVVVSVTGAGCFSAIGLYTIWIVKDLKVTCSGAGTNGLFSLASYIQFSNLDFGTCGQAHINAQIGAIIEAIEDYAISGATPLGHFTCVSGGRIQCINRTVTITGTMSFGAAFGFARIPVVGGVAMMRISASKFNRYAISATVAAGGAGYAIGDTITLTGGTFTTAIVLTVTGVAAGVVTTVAVSNPGLYSVDPANPVAQGATSGVGAGATFNVVWNVTGRRYDVNNNGVIDTQGGGANYLPGDVAGTSATGGLYA